MTEAVLVWNGLVSASPVLRAEELRTVNAVDVESEHEVPNTFARDPWNGSHLDVDSIDASAGRLDRRPP